MELDPKDYRILIVDDEQDNIDAFRFNFRKGFTIDSANGGHEALEKLETNTYALIVTDQRMPKMTGVELLEQAAALSPETLGIILTAYTDVDVLVDAINLGRIHRYVTKPWDAAEMRGVLTQSIERFHLVQENKRLQEKLQEYTGYLDQEIHGSFDFGNIIGESDALKRVLEQVEQVAPTQSTVLLRGETGTGKELVAHAIHINSTRDGKPFVRVNCAALAPGVLESELFGHEKGAFTGATTRRAGRFELADGGTLFLDECGDLPMEVQIKLLRTLQEKEFERVGGTETIKVDVRVVSATNRNLEEMIQKNEFREDLYYRLNVFPVHLPPLRDRPDDVELLAQHFAEKFSPRHSLEIRESALEKLRTYNWPGNVRELENIIERATILSGGASIGAEHLDVGESRTIQTPRPSDNRLDSKLQNHEKQEIISAIENSGGNIAAAARSLGLNRSTLYYRLKKHSLERFLPTKLRVPHTSESQEEA